MCRKNGLDFLQRGHHPQCSCPGCDDCGCCVGEAEHAFQLLPGLIRHHPDTVRNGIPAHVVGVAVLIQLDGNYIVTGTDQILLDLLVGSLNGRDDGNDSGDYNCRNMLFR